MNTYGPSSRPRKPYPLALLNHFTVPFKRSATCAPYFLRIPPEKARFPGSARNVQELCCSLGELSRLGITHHGLAGSSVCRDGACPVSLGGSGNPVRGDAASRVSTGNPLLPRPSRHLRQPQDAGDRLRVANAPLERHPLRLRQTEKPDRDLLVRLGLGRACLEAACQVDGHRFVEKAGAYVEMQDSFPLAGAGTGFFPQIPLLGGARRARTPPGSCTSSVVTLNTGPR